ncbi:MAG TPA: methyltransferase domain-containing protein [Euzebya sp.]|nr:methyltransferase domain-containing protein [Euzebya sp.]
MPAELLLTRLEDFSGHVVAAMTTAAAHRGGEYLNGDGGDLGGGVSATLVVRHAAHHLAVLQIAQAMGVAPADLLDVGCGTGAAASTLAEWMGARLHLCDQDPAPLAVAQRAFAPASATVDLADAPDADVVTSMDVVEHVAVQAQDDFVAALAGKVRPGGLLALATPDESSYPGGWSGYRPHIACLSPVQLQRLLSRATGRPATVLRLAGGPFRPHRGRQAWERAANAVWGTLSARTPDAAAALARLRTGSVPSAAAVRECAHEPVVAVAPFRTRSTGLLGIVQL